MVVVVVLRLPLKLDWAEMFDSGVYTRWLRDYKFCAIGIVYAGGDAVPDIGGEVNYGFDLADGNALAPWAMKEFAIFPLQG